MYVYIYACSLGGPFACLNSTRYGIAWGALGAIYFYCICNR